MPRPVPMEITITLADHTKVRILPLPSQPGDKGVRLGVEVREPLGLTPRRVAVDADTVDAVLGLANGWRAGALPDAPLALNVELLRALSVRHLRGLVDALEANAGEQAIADLLELSRPPVSRLVVLRQALRLLEPEADDRGMG